MVSFPFAPGPNSHTRRPCVSYVEENINIDFILVKCHLGSSMNLLAASYRVFFRNSQINLHNLYIWTAHTKQFPSSSVKLLNFNLSAIHFYLFVPRAYLFTLPSFHLHRATITWNWIEIARRAITISCREKKLRRAWLDLRQKLSGHAVGGQWRDDAEDSPSYCGKSHTRQGSHAAG